MEIFGFNPSDMLSYFLTLFRLSVVLFLLPFFGGGSIPNPVKAALVLVLSLALWPDLSFPASMMPTGWNIVIMFLGELILGLILGMLVNFLFAAVQLGGQIIGFQMGFAMVNVVDPITGTSNAVSAHFLYMCTMLTFLVLNGHLYLLKAVGMSFDYIPPGTLLLQPELADDIFHFSNPDVHPGHQDRGPGHGRPLPGGPFPGAHLAGRAPDARSRSRLSHQDHCGLLLSRLHLLHHGPVRGRLPVWTKQHV